MTNLEVCQEALEVLYEFVSDVESVGVDEVDGDWPDLATTYRNAKDLLRRAKRFSI